MICQERDQVAARGCLLCARDVSAAGRNVRGFVAVAVADVAEVISGIRWQPKAACPARDVSAAGRNVRGFLAVVDADVAGV